MLCLGVQHWLYTQSVHKVPCPKISQWIWQHLNTPIVVTVNSLINTPEYEQQVCVAIKTLPLEKGWTLYTYWISACRSSTSYVCSVLCCSGSSCSVGEQLYHQHRSPRWQLSPVQQMEGSDESLQHVWRESFQPHLQRLHCQEYQSHDLYGQRVQQHGRDEHAWERIVRLQTRSWGHDMHEGKASQQQQTYSCERQQDAIPDHDQVRLRERKQDGVIRTLQTKIVSDVYNHILMQFQ